VTSFGIDCRMRTENLWGTKHFVQAVWCSYLTCLADTSFSFVTGDFCRPSCGPGQHHAVVICSFMVGVVHHTA